jgi:adenosylmethionine-8-amino-7-oxononanoate aminotransferase
LLIADEVITGFGRTGEWFGTGYYNLKPDIITIAKGLSSGYLPIGGSLVSDKIVAGLEKGGEFAHGYTFSGHPVACAAALANIEVIENEGLLERVREISPFFLSRLKELEDLAIVGEVRGRGLVACIDCVADKQSRNPLMLDYEVGNRIDRHCQALGLIVRPMINMCVMSPPLVIAEYQIDRMVEILREGIERTQRDLRAEGVI